MVRELIFAALYTRGDIVYRHRAFQRAGFIHNRQAPDLRLAHDLQRSANIVAGLAAQWEGFNYITDRKFLSTGISGAQSNADVPIC